MKKSIPDHPNLNREVIMREGEFLIRMRVIQARESYGHIDYLITPVKGSGEAWVRETRLVFP